MKKQILILIALVVFLAVAFFMLSKNDSEDNDEPKHPQVIKETKKIKVNSGKQDQTLKKFADELAKPVDESEEASKPPKPSEKKPSKEVLEMQKGMLKATRKIAEKSIKIAQKICAKDTAQALEKVSNCTLKVLESEGFSLESVSGIGECSKKHGGYEQDYLDCQLNVKIEIAKEYCTPEEVDIFTAFSKCFSDHRSTMEQDIMDIKETMEISQKCMNDHPIAQLSPKCYMGMAGMN